MYYYEVAPNQIVRAGSDFFTYSSDSQLSIGQIVTIDVGKKQMIGVVFGKVPKPDFDTKPIKSLVVDNPLPLEIIKLSSWLGGYYNCPIATILQSILPRGIQKNRRTKIFSTEVFERDRTSFLFTDEQLSAIKNLDQQTMGTYILQGVTGSGKTAIYIDQAKKAYQRGQSIIVVVPEIALTSQIMAEFSNHFENILLTHSKMTEAARHCAWQRIINNDKPSIIIGPRSTLFSPVRNVGLIIIDEAHEPSLKQEQSPKYSALRTATMLGRFHSSKVIFGSATPNVSERYLAEQNAKTIIKLTKPAKKNAKEPKIFVVDMKKRENFHKHRFFSNTLLEIIKQSRENNEQTLIFHNRRGTTSTTLCEKCGWNAKCSKCLLPQSLHGDRHQLICHVCGQKNSVPTSCPICFNTNIIHKGIGTKLIESEIKKLFPNLNIARFDADNSNDETIYSNYSDVYNGKIDIIIGTQIVAKGLDLPHLHNVAIIQADTGLALPDYNSNERVFQLITQVVGRVGRNQNDTNVIIQSYQPNHPSIAFGLKQDYESYYQLELAERKRAKFPPFVHMLKLTCIYKTEAACIKNAIQVSSSLRSNAHSDVTIFGPAPAFYEFHAGSFRWQLILKSPKRQHLIDLIKFIPNHHWQYDLDPTSLL